MDSYNLAVALSVMCAIEEEPMSEDNFGMDDYTAKISEFRKWLHHEFISDGCGDPKVDGCLSCEAVLVDQGLLTMMGIIDAYEPKPKDTAGEWVMEDGSIGIVMEIE